MKKADKYVAVKDEFEIWVKILLLFFYPMHVKRES